MLYNKKHYYLITPIITAISFFILISFTKNIFFTGIVAGFIGVFLGPRVRTVKTIAGKQKTITWMFSNKTFKVYK